MSIYLVISCISAVSAQQQEIQIVKDWITMSDGVRLAMDWYGPKEVNSLEKPVILEYLPYRKEEGRRNRYSLFSYFIEHGYLVARVDIRGTGNSEGKLIEYEYTDQEQKDGLEVIQWLAEHPKTSGDVFMMGISWGGFNALQIAMHKPTDLKGIITMMSTDDIYEDDVHYMDGVMHIDAYEIGQDLSNVLPGAPEFIIDSSYFTNRFDTKPWLLTYKQQQRDGPFWNRASLNSDYTAIDVPVFAIGGLYDGYRDFIPRYLEHADVPVTAILGPWNHIFPNWAEPPPAIEWRDLVVNWMDCILEQNCVQRPIRNQFFAYQQDWHAPGVSPTLLPGYWREEDQWPPKKLRFDTLFLNHNSTLTREKPTFAGRDQLSYKASVGTEASGSVMWWGDWAPDQKNADSQSLLYASETLDEDMEIIGFPQVRIRTSCDTTLAHWVVRLSDESPDGQVTLVTGAAFNGTHRVSAEAPILIDPGQILDLNIEMHFTSWTFRKGHKIRLAISNAQWPMLWPSPYPTTMTIHHTPEGINQFILPVMPHQPDLTTFELPKPDPKLPGYKTLYSETQSGYAEISQSCYNHRTSEAEIIATNSSEEKYPWGSMKYTEEIRHYTNDVNPGLTGVESIYTTSALLPDRTVRWEGHLNFTSDVENFYYRYTRKLFENQALIRERTWNETIKRDHH